jgi:hypothetical protein
MWKDTDMAEDDWQCLGALCEKQYWLHKHREPACAQEGQAEVAAEPSSGQRAVIYC